MNRGSSFLSRVCLNRRVFDSKRTCCPIAQVGMSRHSYDVTPFPINISFDAVLSTAQAHARAFHVMTHPADKLVCCWHIFLTFLNKGYASLINLLKEDFRILYITQQERGRVYRLLVRVIITELSFTQMIILVCMPSRHIMTKVVFRNLMYPFSLPIRLRLKGSRQSTSNTNSNNAL